MTRTTEAALKILATMRGRLIEEDLFPVGLVCVRAQNAEEVVLVSPQGLAADLRQGNPERAEDLIAKTVDAMRQMFMAVPLDG